MYALQIFNASTLNENILHLSAIQVLPVNMLKAVY